MVTNSVRNHNKIRQPHSWSLVCLTHIFALSNCAERCIWKGFEPFSGHCLAKKIHTVFTSSTTLPSASNAKYQLVKLGYTKKAKFLSSFRAWKWHYLLKFYLSHSLLPSSFTFLAPLPLWSLFSFAENLLGFIMVGKVFEKTFRIVRLNGRKCSWEVEPNFLFNPLEYIEVYVHSVYYVHVTRWFKSGRLNNSLGSSQPCYLINYIETDLFYLY